MEFSPDLLQTFDVPLLLIHTKFDESNGVSLLNHGRSNSTSSSQSLSSVGLLPNYNRKSNLANLFNCDEIFIVQNSLHNLANVHFFLSTIELLFQ